MEHSRVASDAVSHASATNLDKNDTNGQRVFLVGNCRCAGRRQREDQELCVWDTRRPLCYASSCDWS